MTEIVFASHTVMVSEKMLIEEIAKQAGSSFISDTRNWFLSPINKKGKHVDDNYEKVDQNPLQDIGIITKSQKEEQYKQAREHSHTIRPQVLDDEAMNHKEEYAQIKRVKMECLDFDWIFNTV